MDGDRNEFSIGEWHVTPLRGVIQGPSGSRRITPKSMDVLLCLARHQGEVVDRETFIEEVWGGRAFSDDPLNRCIAELRRQLGDRAGSGGYIETIPKRGYRLAAEVRPIGETPQPGESGKTRQYLRLAALGVLIILAAFGAWRLSVDMLPDGSIAIAVLPFDSRGEPEQTYFADGVHEGLIAELSRGDTFEVRSRTSTLQYRERTRSLPEIARALGVDIVVEGSVRQAGDTVRVSAQVIRASEDESLWADSIEKSRSVENLFAIQDEIAEEIADALEVTLDRQPSGAQLPTKNIEAYDAFMLGKFHYRRKLPGDIEESVNRFEDAVELDPQFAEAYDWLAYAYNHAATDIGHLAPKEAYPKARAAALRALELEPELATALSILGYIRAVHDRDWIGAVTDLNRAVELAPEDSGTVWSLAHVYSLLDRHEEAIGLTTGFAERGPDADLGRNQLEVANRLIDAGRFGAALDMLGKAEVNGAQPGDIAEKRGMALLGAGQLEEAAVTLEYAVEARQRATVTVGRLAHILARLDRQAEATALLDELHRRESAEEISRLVFATVHTGFGANELAISEIRTAVEHGGREVLGLPLDPFFAPLSDDPNYQQIIEDLGLPGR